tara:strand:+ start:2888 stop:3970 length:1083 start_codon:yes stop_codon:yes gene_type:complete
MKINTKAVFQWDGDKYIEVYNEGFEYNGELSLAIGGQDDLYGRNGWRGEANTGTTGTTGTVGNGSSLAEQFGVDIGDYTDDKDLFTEISDDLKKGAKKGTYDSFFEMQQGQAENQFLADTASLGSTKSGEAIGFAGSTSQSMQMDQRREKFGAASVASEEAVQNKMSESKSVMASIEKGNRQTMLSLKGMEDANKKDKGFWKTEEKDYYGFKKGTGWVCRRLKQEGVVTLKESLKMTRFFIKFLFAHPALAELYVNNAPKLIKKADEDGFDWGDESLKYYFITNVLNLADSGKWELAYREYLDAYMELCDKIGIDLNYNKKLWNMGIFGSIKYWIRMFRNRYFISSFGEMAYVSYRMRRA